MRRLLPLLLLVPSVAHAEILTAENRDLLCTDSYQGKPAVDKDALAYAIVTEAGAGLYLDGANPTGIRDNSVQLRSGDGAPSEPVYVLLHYGTEFLPENNRPFGPNVDLSKDKRALKARETIANLIAQDLQFLTVNGSKKVNSSLTYRAVRQPDTVGAPIREDGWKKFRLLFELPPPLVIVCDITETPDESVAATEIKKSAPPFADVLRLRGTVKDLTVKAEKLKSTKPATIAFQRDAEADTNTFALNGVAGWRFGDSAGVLDAIPFISYEKRSITNKKGDVNKLSPGMLFGYKFENSDLAIHTRLETSYIDDIEQHAHQGKLRLYIDPAFALGDGQGILFGSYLAPLGPVALRPELTLIGDATKIFNHGSSDELAKASDYFGFGGELSMRARLNVGQPFSDFSLQGGIRYLQLLGEIEKENAHRWFASLEYSPENFPYFGLGLSFSDGDNDDTLQDEKLYGLTLTLRY